MRALSFSQPWLWAVLTHKRIENRPWAPPIEMIEQRIALHAAKSWDADGVSSIFRVLNGLDRQDLLGRMPGRKDLYPKSAIIGVATIDRVVTEDRTLPDDQKPWFFGPVGWVLRDVTPIATPIPCKGMLGLWRVDAELERQVLEQLGAAA